MNWPETKNPGIRRGLSKLQAESQILIEVHSRCILSCSGCVELLAWRKVFPASEHVQSHLLKETTSIGVIVRYSFIISLASNIDSVFSSLKLSLQILEVFR